MNLLGHTTRMGCDNPREEGAVADPAAQGGGGAREPFRAAKARMACGNPREEEGIAAFATGPGRRRGRANSGNLGFRYRRAATSREEERCRRFCIGFREEVEPGTDTYLP